jgi:hypothetical protein
VLLSMCICGSLMFSCYLNGGRDYEDKSKFTSSGCFDAFGFRQSDCRNLDRTGAGSTGERRVR